jgi:ABC-type sugar transport system ATPase subunit
MTLADRVVVLDRGELQQIGPPAEVYDRPVNRRVAGFFGWPPMNLLDGTLTALDGSAWFRARDGALTLKVTPPQGVQPGQAVSLGIRPENVRIVGIGSKIDHGPCCRMRVAQVELLGGDSLVTLEWCGQRITCRLPSGQSAQEGQEVDVMLPMNCTHWFDDVTDRALQRGERTG